MREEQTLQIDRFVEKANLFLWRGLQASTPAPLLLFAVVASFPISLPGLPHAIMVRLGLAGRIVTEGILSPDSWQQTIPHPARIVPVAVQAIL